MDELAIKRFKRAEAMPLSLETLDHLPEDVERPTYDRSGLKPGIVHIGVGNFHRAHQAWYLHRLMQAGKGHDWAIVGAGVRPYDEAVRERLMAQDYLTTLIELDPDTISAEVVGSMIDYLPIEDGNAPLIAKLSEPSIRIVSLTITEGGYFIDPATGGFDAAHPEIYYDQANPQIPRTAFGAIIAALRMRRDQGAGPLTVLSCDNLQGNGDIAKQAILSLASMTDTDLADWIEETCSFPNSMVDSIVPATGAEEIALARSIGIADNAPVTHENFRQWIIEDSFCAGRPELDFVGATFTDNVHGYEALKLRILNAGHQMVANAGELLNLATIDQCMNDPRVGAFFDKVQRTEVLRHVDGVEDTTPELYLDLVTRRFKNSAVRDTTRRVAFDGSSRHTGFVLPIIRDALQTDAPIEGLALTEALWARMCAGFREDTSQIEPNDPFWPDLYQAALDAKTDPLMWLNQPNLYGDIAQNDRFAAVFSKALGNLWTNGVAETIDAYIAH